MDSFKEWMKQTEWATVMHGGIYEIPNDLNADIPGVKSKYVSSHSEKGGKKRMARFGFEKNPGKSKTKYINRDKGDYLRIPVAMT